MTQERATDYIRKWFPNKVAQCKLKEVTVLVLFPKIDVGTVGLFIDAATWIGSEHRPQFKARFISIQVLGFGIGIVIQDKAEAKKEREED